MIINRLKGCDCRVARSHSESLTDTVSYNYELKLFSVCECNLVFSFSLFRN